MNTSATTATGSEAMSKIEWTEQTWNPIVGCSIVSPGCTNCYAMRMAARLEAMAVAHAGKRVDSTADLGPLGHYLYTTQPSKAGPVWTGKVALAPDRVLTEPLRRRKPTTYFVNSMSDLFHEDVPDAWIDRVFAVMALSPQHTFQVLTKRAARMRTYFTEAINLGSYDTNRPTMLRWCIQIVADESGLERPKLGFPLLPLPNVWLGVSAERQQEADARIPDLLATPAAVRFVSAEPLLGAIDFARCDPGRSRYQDALRGQEMWDSPEPLLSENTARLDWVIVGGESGPGARPMHPDWARAIRDQCAAAGVPFFFKQWGAWAPGTHVPPGVNRIDTAHWCDGWEFGSETKKQAEGGHIDDEPDVYRVGKAVAGRLLDGREHNAMPAPPAQARASTPAPAESTP